MVSKILLASSLMAATASATHFMAHAEMKREVLQARQTEGIGGISEECQSAILEVYDSVPTPPPAVVSDAVDNPQTDPCSFSTPASLSKEYASYSSEVVSWLSDNEDQLSSVLSECPILSQYATMIPVCATDALPNSASASATATETSAAGSQSTASDSDDDDDSTSAGESATQSSDAAGSASATATEGAATQTTNAAHRETGMAIAAMAVAGVVLAL